MKKAPQIIGDESPSVVFFPENQEITDGREYMLSLISYDINAVGGAYEEQGFFDALMLSQEAQKIALEKFGIEIEKDREKLTEILENPRFYCEHELSHAENKLRESCEEFLNNIFLKS